jgi:hypothetical protein
MDGEVKDGVHIRAVQSEVLADGNLLLIRIIPNNPTELGDMHCNLPATYCLQMKELHFPPSSPATSSSHA